MAGRPLSSAAHRDDEPDAVADQSRAGVRADATGAARVGDALLTESLLDYAAIALFVERATAAKGSFELTAHNAAAVTAICRRLDGLPLALELAAARMRLLSPELLLEQLGHALDVLTTGSRDQPSRHQTLRATIDWSHFLLSEPEQRLFRRMAVFVGGCSFADLAAVCSPSDSHVLDELQSLVDKALVTVDGPDDRVRMLQTIQEYARERLEIAGEADELALRHAHRYAAFAQHVRDGIEGTDQVRSLARGILDEGNVLAAHDTLLAAARAGSAAAAEAGMQMAGDLFLYWHLRGKNLTARDYSASFLAADTAAAPTVGRAGALATSGLASWILGQNDQANIQWAEAHRIAGELDAERELCVTAFCIGLGQIGVDAAAGIRATSAGIERSRAARLAWAEAFCGTVEGMLYAVSGDVETARRRYAEALTVQRRIGDAEGSGLSLGGLAALAAGSGDLTDALDLYRRSLAAFEAVGDRAEEARILGEMAWTQLRIHDPTLARWFFLESAQAYTDVASVRGVGLSLIGLAAVEVVEGRPGNAAQIAAAAEVYAAQEGIVDVYADETPGREFVDRARASLPADETARATEGVADSRSRMHSTSRGLPFPTEPDGAGRWASAGHEVGELDAPGPSPIDLACLQRPRRSGDPEAARPARPLGSAGGAAPARPPWPPTPGRPRVLTRCRTSPPPPPEFWERPGQPSRATRSSGSPWPAPPPARRRTSVCCSCSCPAHASGRRRRRGRRRPWPTGRSPRPAQRRRARPGSTADTDRLGHRPAVAEHGLHHDDCLHRGPFLRRTG